MPKCVMIVPFANGSAQFPGVLLDTIQGWVCGSYVPPPPLSAPYVLVWMEALQASINTLTARADCLFVANITADGAIETKNLPASERNDTRTKISNMGFTGAQYGLLNAAIQSSQNRDELAVTLATKAFFRSPDKKAMTEQDFRGTFK